MFYDKELQFLINVFEKSHIRVTLVSPKDPLSEIIDIGLENIAGYDYPSNASVEDFLGKVEHGCMYKLSDRFEFFYIFLRLPERQGSPILFIGPYILSPPSKRRLLEIGEKNGISPKNQKLFEMKYEGTPVLPENSALLVMLDAFCELVFKTKNFHVIDIKKEGDLHSSPLITERNNTIFDETMIKMKNVEKRYNYENELMNAVTLGHIHKIDLLFSTFSDEAFEKRISDQLRNRKNYLIISNTLLRKAAEQGGVHPIYLDSISSSFAIKIEALTSTSETSALMQDMFRSYCRLVRSHSMKDYSPIVQKVITLIDSDLSADLTLSSIAKDQNVSSGYLCALFKKETGKTITEFIRDKRIKYASHLLRTTHLQIQTIALHCGIMDVQYFSKIFKKLVGMTPKEYRESSKQ